MPDQQSTIDFKKMDEMQLVTCCQTGQLDAFNELISRYENKVLNQAARYLRDYHTALDEAQEIFIKVFKKIQKFKGESSFGTWLYRVTANHCLNVIEKQRVRQHVALQPDQHAMFEQGTIDIKSKSPEQLWEETIRHDQLAKAISRLPADLEKIIVLRHYEELSYDDIADLLGVPVTTVCSSLYRARKQLKTIMQQVREEK